MNDSQVLTQLAETDAYAPGAEMPSSAWSRETARSEIERRMGMEPPETTDQPTITNSQQQQEAAPPPRAPDQVITAPQQRTSPGRRRPLLVGVGAVAAVLFVGAAALGIVAVVGDDAPSPVAAPTATATPVTTQPPTTTVPPFTVDEALAVKDAYIEASNAGDVDAVLALFEPDAIVRVGFFTGLVTFERYLVWSIAHGTTVTASDCTANELEDGVRLRCGSTRHQHLAAAVGAPVPGGTLHLTVSADGIRSFSENNDPADFAVVNVPFDRWLAENHSDDFDTRGDWGSVAEAEQAGTLRRQYADEWAAYLDANGCTYQDDC